MVLNPLVLFLNESQIGTSIVDISLELVKGHIVLLNVNLQLGHFLVLVLGLPLNLDEFRIKGRVTLALIIKGNLCHIIGRLDSD